MVGYGSPHVSQAQIKAQQQAFDNKERETYEQGLKDHHSDVLRYQCENASYPIKTKFTSMDLDTMKAMLGSVDPGGVKDVGAHWQRVHDNLVTGGDSAHSQLKRAVDNVMAHWEGESADQFRRHADKILQQISNTATHAHTVAHALDQTSQDLTKAKSHLDGMSNPGWFSSAWDSLTDSGRDDKYTKEDIAARRLPPDVLAQVDEGYMSEQDETNLKAANVMETLARSYVGTTQHLNSSHSFDRQHNEIPPSNPTVPMPTPIPSFSGSSSTPSSSRPSTPSANFTTVPKPGEVTGPRDLAISGGKQIPVTSTQIDGLQGGITGHPPESIPGGGLPGGGTGPGGPGMKSPIGLGGFPGGMPDGNPGGTAGGRFSGGRTGGVRGGIGSSAAEEGQGGRGGMRGGMRGMHGMGGGGGAKGGRSLSGGRGPLARAKGGVAGAPKGIAGGKGPATPGGTGLGKGRGSGASAAGGRGGRGMLAGGMRGANQHPGEEENDEGTRPDYLVEDEETWTPEDYRSVPKNIE